MAKYAIIPMVLGRLGDDKSAMMYFTDVCSMVINFRRIAGI
jgi:hypothetical protein